jgi:hypothetical protein
MQFLGTTRSQARICGGNGSCEWLTAPPFTPAFGDAKAKFAGLLKADGFALFEKVLEWFQAHLTIPSRFFFSAI